MPPFVSPQRRKKKNRSKSPSQSEQDNFEISLLVIAKRVGLSFDELNQMTLDEFFNYVDIWVGDDANEPRPATQADIDAFYKM